VATFQIALLLHIFGVIVMLSGIATATVAFYAARRRRRASEIAAVLSVSSWGVVLGGIGFAFTIGFGLWLVHVGGFSYTESWLVAAYALFAASNVLGGAAGGVPKRARLLAQRLAGEDDRPNDELRRLLHHQPELLNHAATAMMLAVLVVMVWRP
jgi:uncharacterized membrane protein